MPIFEFTCKPWDDRSNDELVGKVGSDLYRYTLDSLLVVGVPGVSDRGRFESNSVSYRDDILKGRESLCLSDHP